VLIKSDEDIPRFVHLTAAKRNDTFFTDMIHLPKGSIVTYDRGYVTYTPLLKWQKQGVTAITRLRVAWMHKVTGSRKISAQEKKEGIISDQLILLGGKPVIEKVPGRKIIYRDNTSGKLLTFVTNNTRMKTSTVAGIYKRRWQIECLFKRLKQNYPLKYFLGDSENAIKIQIWCSLITDMLIKAIKDKVRRKWSFSNIASMIRLHLMTYINLINFLEAPEKVLRVYPRPIDDLLQLFPTLI
jgi:IS4 transposase